MENEYVYPYNDAQVHEALEDLDRRLKALEPKKDEPGPVMNADDPNGLRVLADTSGGE